MAADRIAVSKAQHPLFLGVDVGGTSIKLGVVDDLGRTIETSQVSTDEHLGPESAVTRTHAAMTELLASLSLGWDAIAAVGLGTPGSMDIPRGMILEPPNMPHWRYYPMRDELRALCKKPVAFANDANAAAYGEYWIGGGQKHDSMVMFTLGTGVGGGIILDGVSLDGGNSFGSELGHILIDHSDQARICVWGGGQGQLEAYASAPAVVARMQESLDSGKTSSLSERMEAGEQLTTLMMAEEAEKGDSLSLEIILETARFLGVGIVTVVHTVDPGAVILGGAMDFGGHSTEIGGRFLARIQEEFRERAYHVVRDVTAIDFAQLGGSAGYIGAAGLARHLINKQVNEIRSA
jgi:glucokinase